MAYNQTVTGGAASSGENNQGQCVGDAKKPMGYASSITPVKPYTFSNPMRAKVVIFNHHEFDEPGVPPRLGTERDVKTLLETLPKLGFHFEDIDINVHQDLTSVEIQITLDNLAKIDFSKYNCLMVFVFTHGSSDSYLGARDKSYKVQTLWENFVAHKCKTLVGKPKIFIIQACRSCIKYDENPYNKTVPLVTEKGTIKIEHDQEPKKTTYVTHNLPVLADFLHVYSSAEGQASWRYVERGSWFIQSLCEHLLKYSKELDFLEIIRETTSSLVYGVGFQKEEESGIMKQVPAYYTTLTRALYFRPTQ